MVVFAGGKETIFSLGAALLCVLLHRSPIPILVNTVIAHIGRVSFSMYVLHFALFAPTFFAVLTTLRMLNTDFAVVFPVYYLTLVGVAFGLACMTFALIEAPFMALGRRAIANFRRVSPSVSTIANSESAEGRV